MTRRHQPKTVAAVVYRFDAPPQDLFDAWLDPDFAGKWWFTSPTSEMNTTRIDGRLGGEYEIVDRRDGITYRAIGTFIEFDRPHRLAFPQRFYLTSRCVVWDLAEVEAWLDARRHASRANAIKRAPSPDVRLRRSRPVKH